jgi:hypothetical protein
VVKSPLCGEAFSSGDRGAVLCSVLVCYSSAILFFWSPRQSFLQSNESVCFLLVEEVE